MTSRSYENSIRDSCSTCWPRPCGNPPSRPYCKRLPPTQEPTLTNTARFVVTVTVPDDVDPQYALLQALGSVKGEVGISPYVEPPDPLGELRAFGERFKAAGEAFAAKLKEGMEDG